MAEQHKEMDTGAVLCSPARPCPICGGGRGCAVRADDSIECGALGRDKAAAKTPHGYRHAGEIAGQLGLVLYERTGEPIAPADESREKHRRSGIRHAREIWQHAAASGANHERVRAYLAARGVPVDRFPGGAVPPSLAFLEQCPEEWIAAERRWTLWPAMVGRVVEVVQEHARLKVRQTGVHRIFLDPGGQPRKRSEGEESKKMRGACRGRAVWLGEDYSRGVLVWCEGIETGAAIHAATGLPVWCCLSAEFLWMQHVPGALFDQARPKAIHTVIIAADLDRSRIGKKGRVNFVEKTAKFLRVSTADLEALTDLGTGECWAHVAAEVLHEQYPWVNTAVRVPDATLSATLTEKGLFGADRNLAPKVKTVDWLDVCAVAGAEVVVHGLLEGVDPAANRARAAEKFAVAAKRPALAGGSGGKGSPADAGSLGVAGGEELVECIDGVERRPMPDEDLLLARRFVEELYAPPAESRAGSRFHLLALDLGDDPKARAFRRFDGAVWRAVSRNTIAGQVRRWLHPCAKARPRKDGIDWVQFKPGLAKVSAIVQAIQQEVLVEAELDRFWMRPTYDRSGRPTWGIPPWAAACREEELAGRPAPPQVMTFRNFQVSTVDLDSGQLKPWVNTPLLYNETLFPYDLPVDELQRAIAEGDWTPLYDKYCPTWVRFLEGLEWTEEEHTLLQCWTGYAQRFDVSRKDMNVLFLLGVPDTGKGTCESGVQLAVSPLNVVKSSFGEFPDKFHRAGWRHKLVVAISESESAWDDNPESVRVLKTASGGDTLNSRDLYEKERTNDPLWVRFLCSMNTLPNLRDAGGGLLNRVKALEFRARPAKLDPGVRLGILREGLGLVLWGLEGGMRLAKLSHVPQPARSMTVFSLWSDSADPLREFVTEWVSITNRESDFLPSMDLFSAYCCWRGKRLDSRNAGAVNKDIYSGLRRCKTDAHPQGWVGEHTQPRTGEGKRGSGWTGLHLTELAVKQIRIANAPREQAAAEDARQHGEDPFLSRAKAPAAPPAS